MSSIAFWSAKVNVNNPCDVQPPEGFVLNVQQAALSENVEGAMILKVSTVSIQGEDLEAVIGTLRPIHSDQITLNLVFGHDVPVTFSISGNSEGFVHLNGYFQPGIPEGTIPHLLPKLSSN